MFVRNGEDKGLPFEVSFEMGRISMELIIPAQRCVSSNDLIVFSEAKSDSIFHSVADSVEFLDAEVVIAGSEDQFK